MPASVANKPIPNPRFKLLHDRVQQTFSLAMERAAGHLHDPKKYPLPADTSSLEHAIYAVYNALPRLRQRKVVDKLKGDFESSGVKRKSVYGDLAGVRFNTAQTVTEQVTSIAPPDHLRITQQDLDEILAGRNTAKRRAKNKTITAVNKQVPRQAAAPLLALIADSLTCEKKSELSKDEISMGAFGIDSTGLRQDLPLFFAGEFKKGQTITLNRRLFTFATDTGSVGEDNIFTAGLFLMEKDLMSNNDLANKLERLFYLLMPLFITIGSALVLVSLLGGPAFVVAIIAAFSVSLLLPVASRILSYVTDDFSAISTDTLTLGPVFAVGDRFDRTLRFTLENGPTDLTVGKYKAAVHWEVVTA